MRRISMGISIAVAVVAVGCSGADLGGITDTSSGTNSPSGVSDGSDAGSSSDGSAGGASDSGGIGGGRDSGSRASDGGSGSTGDAGDDFSVDWIQGCWQKDSGKKFQAMNFKLTSDAPMPLEGTLFYNETCDPKDGTDNLNDTGGTTPPGTWLFWFIHHPDQPSTSAVWWFGDQKSACIDYKTAPDCE